MQKISLNKLILPTMLMVCTFFLLTSSMAQAQCTTNADCWGGACVDGFCVDTCEDNEDCNNGLFCDGLETCDTTALPAIGLCVPGEIPCGADFCDEEAAPGYQCVECSANADCFGGVCRLSDNVCVECKLDSHCDNGRFCDGPETCVNNICELGEIPCAGQFCNETDNGSCLTCDDTADCHGLGTCVANECVECTQDSDCDNAEYCDGEETCNAGVCISGPLPCAGDFCNETNNVCLTCEDDADCFGGVCENNVCLECRQRSDCGNGLWCDGRETCNSGVCEEGNIRCAGEFCDEDANECLECEADADCIIEGVFDGMCNETLCVECLIDTDCDDGDFCNGEETCDIVSGACVAGALPCANEFCNETSNSCQTCNIDANCGVNGMCINKECVECEINSDCRNGLWCDGWERCNEGICEAGTPRCSGEFCNEDTNTCLDCIGDDNCTGVCDENNLCVDCLVDDDCERGFCSNKTCVECRNSSDCDNGLWCDGADTCNETTNLCEPVGGDIPCASQFCNEDDDTCLTCLDDDDCFGGVCDDTNNLCAECLVNADCDSGFCKISDNVCVECKQDDHCNNNLYCDGIETCENNICITGDIPCPGDFCNETATGASCQDCEEDADCHIGGDGTGRCINNVCMDCFGSEDCDNNLFCDGIETCEAGICQLGDIPCAGQFCDEPTDICLTCLDDEDCFGGVCDGDNLCAECLDDDDCEGAEVCSDDNICVECLRNGQCDNDLWCDGLETCDRDAGICLPGAIPCPGDFCNESSTDPGTGNCQECEVDADCHIGGEATGRCIYNICMDCFGSEDCDNGLFCDGAEICEAGICQDGVPECDGDFCDEDADECLTCIVDEDCLGLGRCLDNTCVECTENADCNNDIYCDGEETCVANKCVLGDIPCPGVYCDEDDGCLTCVEDADCCRGDDPNCEGGRCINNVCFDCFYESDCDNGLFCDGIETCEAGICQLGDIPCAGDFCNEAADSCLTCLGDEDCFGGVCLDSLCVECTVDDDCDAGFCVDNLCVECVEDATCDNGMYCDGLETCDAGMCVAGTEPCEGGACDETDDMCLPCVADSDCGDFSSCVNTECVPFPIASPLTNIKLKGPGLAEVIFDPNMFDIAWIKLTKTTEKSMLTITSDMKNFPLYIDRITVDGSLKAIKGKDVILTGAITTTGGIDKIQIKGADMGCSIEAPWIGTLSSAGDFSCDVMLAGTGSPKSWKTLNKLDIKGKIWDSELLITGDVGNTKVGFWGAGATLAVGVEAGPDGLFFTGDDVATEGELKKFNFKDYESLNDGIAFGIIANEFGKTKNSLPFGDNDFNIQQVD